VAAGNYTAWHYRRFLIDELKLPLIEEMDYLRKIGPEYEKNYQIWHHRRCISEVLSDPDDLKKEKSFLQEIFKSDAKNYHAWSYRIWLVERF
jgi:protein farnesyltransferase/geranylgeranyltransferase type-1 subunit alpha